MKKYALILSDMEEKIRQGKYRPGQKLPSVRSAAEAYGCSISTITRAYAELEKRHVIYSVPQSGYYVVVKPGEWRDERDGSMIYFATVLPDLDAFPYLDFQHCLNKAIDIYKYDLFTYGDPLGLESFRHTLVSHLASDQVFTKVERIFVTSGAQQALEILAKMPFPNGREAVLVEQPSYDRYLRFLETEKIPVHGIARTAAGIDLQELERWFKGGSIKFFYTMSRYHNPLGTSYNAEERRGIAKLAAKYGVYILEDDYMADLGADQQSDPIYASDGGEYVIYVKSFSKIIFPGLRLGAIVLPERLLNTFYAYKIYPDTSLLSQAALEVYIKNGMYERHKHKIAGLYAARMLALNESVNRHNEPGLMEVPDIRSGIYTHFKLRQTVNVEQLLRRLAERNVSVVSGKGFYLSNYLDKEKFLRISISQTGAEQIEEGVRIITEEVRKGSR
ncbi:aminotransferase-like domain-containing protein [Paenibacillus glycanilyticus]|uniref:aminotransferase-like domain-containing protein n=1 Tax=Paenibacillus glycanilyticus TaxID=126569 RepID=UPI000FD8B2E7|nr:PLP-dependent aminotransferase family protein [Paenibacillus glycanilyticus]